MRKIYALVTFTFSFIIALGQPVNKIGKYIIQPVQGAETQLVFEMSFGKADIVHITGDTALMHNAGEIMIDMVCTDYPKNLSLVYLNKRRMQSFFAMFPYINKNQVVLQNIFRQTGGNTEAAAHTMFHGLVVTFRPAQNDTTMQGDIAKLEQMLEPAEPAEMIDTSHKKLVPKARPAVKKDTPGEAAIPTFLMTILPDGELKETEHGTVSGGTNLVMHTSPIAVDTPLTISPGKALKRNIITQQVYDNFRHYNRIIILVTKSRKPVAKMDINDLDSYTATPDTIKTGSRFGFRAKYPPIDSTILKILGRNSFKDATVVTDVTASMYMYTGQVLLWIKQHAPDSLATSYVFFNDGDATPNDKKKIGSTGGIYSRECTTAGEVKNLARAVMAQGCGGDIPENDIEALLYAEKQFPKNKREILIADNWAPVRDKQLINQLTRPVDVMLCGADGARIKTEYLDLARQTHGTLHLKDTDILNFDAMGEGYVLVLGNYRYIIKNNRFEYDY